MYVLYQPWSPVHPPLFLFHSHNPLLLPLRPHLSFISFCSNCGFKPTGFDHRHKGLDLKVTTGPGDNSPVATPWKAIPSSFRTLDYQEFSWDEPSPSMTVGDGINPVQKTRTAVGARVPQPHHSHETLSQPLPHNRILISFALLSHNVPCILERITWVSHIRPNTQ